MDDQVRKERLISMLRGIGTQESDLAVAAIEDPDMRLEEHRPVKVGDVKRAFEVRLQIESERQLQDTNLTVGLAEFVEGMKSCRDIDEIVPFDVLRLKTWLTVYTDLGLTRIIGIVRSA